MRRLVLKMSVSLDGFVGGPNGEIDWIFKTMDGGATAWLVDTLWQAGVHVMGSRTYQDMVAYWPTSTEPFAAPMNEIPKVVFTKKGRLESSSTTRALADATRVRGAGSAVPALASWTDPVVAVGTIEEEIGRLKAQPGKDILAHGGASFAQSLARSGLIDEYRLLMHPIALGRGLPLFGGLDRPVDLKLHSTVWFSGGAVAQVYRPA